MGQGSSVESSNIVNSQSVSKARIAIRSGNIGQVKKLVTNSYVVNKPDKRGWTLLHEAAVNDQFVDIARFLISAGAIVDYRTPKGVTPFYLACKHGCEIIGRMLIELGCDINTPIAVDYVDDKKCMDVTPLHITCHHGNSAILKMLLEKNVNINASDRRRRTAVHVAVNNSNGSAIRLLIEAGANVEMRDSQGYTPLHHACMLGKLEMFNILIEYLGCGESIINQRTPEGWTLLMLACSFQQYPIAEKLIECGADTTVINCMGLLALHLVAGAECDLFKLVLLNTPNEAMERYSSYRNGFDRYRSLPCSIIDSGNFENLKLLYQSGVSEAVLKCPSIIKSSKGYILSPIGHLLLFSGNSSSDNENALKLLEFLLSYEFLINPVYGEMNHPERTMSLFETVVNMHSSFHEGCHCETFLSLILAKISSPLKGLPSDSPRQFSLINKIARFGFVAGLNLLKYIECIEPDEVMEIFLREILEPYYRWTGREHLVVKFLQEKSTTNFMSKILMIRYYISNLIPLDIESQIAFISMFDEIYSNIRVSSLRRISRFVLRKHIRKKAKASHLSFRSYVQNMQLSSFWSKYILYEIDF